MAQQVKDLALALQWLLHCYDAGSIPGLGTSTYRRHPPPKKNKCEIFIFCHNFYNIGIVCFVKEEIHHVHKIYVFNSLKDA